MKNYKKGFTLLELLVVVLIIGILAAVALPQYRKAVERARMTEAITSVETIYRAQQDYYAVNGQYTRNINELIIDFPGEDVSYGSISAKQGKYFTFTSSNKTGDFVEIALVSRNPAATRYTLTLRENHLKKCYTYSQASKYEENLCKDWERN